ncbi:MAG: hypothetical protein ACI4V5_03945 [Prevotella sp.]
MKRIFTFIVAVAVASAVKAQMHSTLKFVGPSKLSVSTTEIESANDTIMFAMTSTTTGDITLPDMKGMGTIPSFTIKNATFSMGTNHVITFDEQTFTTTVTVDGTEKNVTGSSLSGTYNPADNSLRLSVVFKYGSMPLEMTYAVTSFYVKPVTNSISVVVGGSFTYTNNSVTYNVRKYMENDIEKVDVEVPSYTLNGTVMGDITLGTYTVKGLLYDENMGGYYRDYKDDGLSFHFTAEQNGVTTMDGEYSFNSQKDNNILVKYNGSNISSIVNTFQMGAMPFGIVTVFDNGSTGISNLTTDNRVSKDNETEYDIWGRRVGNNAKGIIIKNGKKYLRSK